LTFFVIEPAANFLQNILAVIGTLFIALSSFYIFLPNKYAQLKTNILSEFRWISNKIDKRYIKQDIQTSVNNYNKDNLGFDVPFGINITWEDGDPHLNDGDVVLRLNKGDNQPHNVAIATLQYTEKAVLPESRSCIDEDINEGINYTLSLDILNQSNKKTHGGC
jgi:hypothetical protein